MVRAKQLHTLTIGDEPAAWRQAGFVVDGDHLRIGATTIHLVGGPRRGIVALGICGVGADVDGLDCTATEAVELSSPAHPNMAVAIDHVVVTTPDFDRTRSALDGVGLVLRRERRVGGDPARRQGFFWMGDVILELVGPEIPDREGPAQPWGLALVCVDMTVAADLLGTGLGRARPAVQPGRSIATMRTKEFDMSVPTVLMTPHVDD